MIREEELYNDGKIRLVEYNVMLEGECIAKSWREFYLTEEVPAENIIGTWASGTSDVEGLSYYTLPLWYQRYKKLDEIL